MCALFLLHGRLPGGTYPLGEGSAIVCTNESDGAVNERGGVSKTPSVYEFPRGNLRNPVQTKGRRTSVLHPSQEAGDSPQREVPSVSWELPDPQRDEDFPDDPVIESLEHHCIVLTHDQWMCEDCGSMFPRDPSLGDFPEQAIIEGSWVCVAYVPERTNA